VSYAACPFFNEMLCTAKIEQYKGKDQLKQIAQALGVAKLIKERETISVV
jgi:hypothetical protein